MKFFLFCGKQLLIFIKFEEAFEEDVSHTSAQVLHGIQTLPSVTGRSTPVWLSIKRKKKK